MSGGLRRGIELVLLAGYTGYFFDFLFRASGFRRVGAKFRRECCDGSESKDLLWSERDAD
jgi:hypothetical protein